MNKQEIEEAWDLSLYPMVTVQDFGICTIDEGTGETYMHDGQEREMVTERQVYVTKFTAHMADRVIDAWSNVDIEEAQLRGDVGKWRRMKDAVMLVEFKKAVDAVLNR